MNNCRKNISELKSVKFQLRPLELLALILIILFALFALTKKDEEIQNNSSFGANKDYQIECTIDVSNKLLQEIAMIKYKQNPALIHSLSSYEFENFIGLLLNRQGYQVEITPKSKDGGKDIVARYQMPTGNTIMCYVECKHYGEGRKVGVKDVRALYGIVKAENINYGILVTSARFTRGAKDFKEANKQFVDLKDFNDIQDWLNYSVI